MFSPAFLWIRRCFGDWWIQAYVEVNIPHASPELSNFSYIYAIDSRFFKSFWSENFGHD